VHFNGEAFGSPWVLMEYHVSPGPAPRRVAIAAHHYTWWPGIVALIDPHGRRLGSFVNAGWVERLYWIDQNRLAISGFNNDGNGGMFAVLDATHPDGHSPDTQKRQFICDDCPAGDPLFYAIFPRSELNVATGSRFNRATLTVTPNRFVLMTDEVA